VFDNAIIEGKAILQKNSTLRNTALDTHFYPQSEIYFMAKTRIFLLQSLNSKL
jgi:hypothetical protein